MDYCTTVHNIISPVSPTLDYVEGVGSGTFCRNDNIIMVMYYKIKLPPVVHHRLLLVVYKNVVVNFINFTMKFTCMCCM